MQVPSLDKKMKDGEKLSIMTKPINPFKLSSLGWWIFQMPRGVEHDDIISWTKNNISESYIFPGIHMISIRLVEDATLFKLHWPESYRYINLAQLN